MPSLRDLYLPASMLSADYSAIEIRLMEQYGISGYGVKKLPYRSGDYIRTKEGDKDLRVCLASRRWRWIDEDHTRLQIKVRRPGKSKSHWSWADRWVKASPLEALAAQAAEELL